jgi:hypothetical protein
VQLASWVNSPIYGRFILAKLARTASVRAAGADKRALYPPPRDAFDPHRLATRRAGRS